jgi:predicted nucleic acid-binding protein
MAGVLGHGHVTDAYLAQLARTNGAKIVTLDRGLAALHADVAQLVSG